MPLFFPWIGAAFLIHFVSPKPYRQWVFVLATIAGTFFLLSFWESLTLIGIAFGMIGITNLRIDLRWRKWILLVVAGLLVYARMNPINGWLSSSVLTILGSIFMFRMLVFLYEIKHQKQPVSFVTQISYFFMLPNLVFPLFPVVDFKLFHRQYDAGKDPAVYQRGILLMAKGIFFLFVYRMIYSFLLPVSAEIDSLNSLVAYMSIAYLLTIRLAGIFHFSVGALHLFGYRLPDVFNNHFFASGFGDLWRRINIYWKDFIIKLYFNPFFFRFKKYGIKTAIALATIFSFVITLLFHQYQTFWITGVWQIGAKDMVFWGFFGLAVMIGSLWQNDIHKKDTFLGSIVLSGRIILTFLTVSVLWSVWSAQSLSTWYGMAKLTQEVPTVEWIVFTGILVVMAFAGGAGHHLSKGISMADFNKVAGFFPLALLVMLVMGFNRLTLDKFWNERLTESTIESIFYQTLNEDDLEQQTAGYYDDILQSGNVLSTRTQEREVALYAKEFEKTGIVQKSQTPIERRFTPNFHLTFQGIDFDINQWGMRDKPYNQTPPPGVTRMAMAGSSIEMGSRVKKELIFESILEERLNYDASVKADSIELLNFSVYAREIAQQAHLIKSELVDFKPQYLLIFHHYEDWGILKSTIRRLKTINYDYALFQEAYDKLEDSYGRLSVLNPLEIEILNGLHADVYETCISNGIQPILVMMPTLKPQRDFRERKSKLDEVSDQASEIGYKVIDLRAAYKGFDPASLRISHNDYHPNAMGHKLLADKLEPVLRKLIINKEQPFR